MLSFPPYLPRSTLIILKWSGFGLAYCLRKKANNICVLIQTKIMSYKILRFNDSFVRFCVKKFIVIGFVVLGAALAVSYAFLASPVYEAKVFIMPPSQSDISNFNYGRMKESELVPYTVKDVYDIYTRSLQAESLRLDFLARFMCRVCPLKSKKSRDVLYSNFSAVLRVVPPLRRALTGMRLSCRPLILRRPRSGLLNMWLRLVNWPRMK